MKFPFLDRDRVIVGERCVCEHADNQHAPQVVPELPMVEVPMQGACMECPCEKFVWKDFIITKAREANDNTTGIPREDGAPVP